MLPERKRLVSVSNRVVQMLLSTGSILAILMCHIIAYSHLIAAKKAAAEEGENTQCETP